MSAHNILYQLNQAENKDGKVIVILDGGAKPSGVDGYAPGCILIITSGSDAGAYKNTGTASSCTFNAI
jgi:hypothetical protein